MDRYNSVNNTKNDFRIAFWKLYGRFPIEKISVSELCRVAGYNRTTFYVYYDNINDLLNHCIDDMLVPIARHADELQLYVTPADKGLLERLYLTVIKAYEPRIELLAERHQLYVLERKTKVLVKPVLQSMYAGNTFSEKWLDYLLEYQLDASFGVMSKWLHEKDMTDQEIVKLLVSCSQCGVATLFEENACGREPIPGGEEKKRAVIESIISEIESLGRE